MTNNISNKVLKMQRNLERKGQSLSQAAANTTTPIRVVSTFGSDNDLVKSVKKLEPVLSRTRSFSLSDAFISPTPSPPVSRIHSPVPGPSNIPNNAPLNRKIFQFVKKTGASIRSRVVKVKTLAIGDRFGKTRPCGDRNCMCCSMISEKTSVKYNKNTVKISGGTCSSYNIIYLVNCTLCNRPYIGRTTRTLKTRIGEHRRNFYKILDGCNFEVDNDEFALGAHLHNHGFSDKNDFSKIFEVCILDRCSPKVLETKEHRYIHLFNSLVPEGINLSNPFSIPLLYKN